MSIAPETTNDYLWNLMDKIACSDKKARKYYE
jgi:hypothetical protein